MTKLDTTQAIPRRETDLDQIQGGKLGNLEIR